MNSGFSAVLGAVMLICILSLLLKNFGFKGVPVFVCVGILCVLSYMSEGLFTLIPMIGDFGEKYCGDIYVKSAIKIVGIGYAVGICKDVCDELGESAVSKCVTVVGRLEIISLCTPFIAEMLESVASLAQDL
jgi:stage III sporulation protein AD